MFELLVRERLEHAGSHAAGWQEVDVFEPLKLLPGRKVPAYCTATGRILLSRFTAAEVELALDTVPRHAFNSSTRVDRSDILDAVESARDTGIAVVQDEFSIGGTELAAIIPLQAGQPLVALSLACISERYRQDPARYQAQLSAAVIETADAMARQGRP